MSINVFGSTSTSSAKTLDPSSLVQEPRLRTNYIESIFEEDLGLKNHFIVKNPEDQINIKEAASK